MDLEKMIAQVSIDLLASNLVPTKAGSQLSQRERTFDDIYLTEQHITCLLQLRTVVRSVRTVRAELEGSRAELLRLISEVKNPFL